MENSENFKIAGTFTAAYVGQHKEIEIPDTHGHIVSLGQAEGTNRNTGEHTHMDGAHVVNVGSGDLIWGNGPHQGYIKFIQNGDSTLSKWNGTVTTTLSSEGTPNITFEGEFSYIHGTGKFENIRGGGVYRGRFTSETAYVCDWEGEYSIAR